MSKKSKSLFIASIITYFLPLIVSIVFWSFMIACYWNTVDILIYGVPTLAGIVFYFVVPLYKKHYYEVKDDPKERKLAIITTCFECGAPILMDLVMIWIYFAIPAYLFLRILFILFLAVFGVINILFWRSFPKEEKKEA